MAYQKELLKNFELRRKAVHVTIGLFFVFLINIIAPEKKIWLAILLVAALIAMIIISAIIKYARLKYLSDFIKLFDKPKDFENFPAKGAIYYLVGIIVAFFLFDTNVTSASILILALGDPAAHLVGHYYGKTKLVINNKKLLEGTLAGVFVGTIAASFFIPLPIAFFGAAFGMIAEAIELEAFNLDDNFFIPFISGIVMKVIISML